MGGYAPQMRPDIGHRCWAGRRAESLNWDVVGGDVRTRLCDTWEVAGSVGPTSLCDFPDEGAVIEPRTEACG
ncbi:hypothetical protein ARTHRO9AX_80001 [Arthrobacter sp. 9AX]|nr:hypothetical protein ARTHRO9AX_80001 [Arthrobacter sp. 9AX]